MYSSTARPQTEVRAWPDRFGGIATLALYGSLALIGAVVFGTLPVHPF